MVWLKTLIRKLYEGPTNYFYNFHLEELTGMVTLSKTLNVPIVYTILVDYFETKIICYFTVESLLHKSALSKHLAPTKRNYCV